MSYKVVFDDELYHHGILGMKWGVRRYQNEDGSLTEAGKKRYEKESAKNQARIAKGEPGYRDEDLKNPELWIAQDKKKTKNIVKTAIKGGLVAGSVISTVTGFRLAASFINEASTMTLGEMVNTPAGSEALRIVADRYDIPMSAVNDAIKQYGDMTGMEAIELVKEYGG